MMTAFDNAFAQTVAYEGGYSNDPDDHGGRTMYGITEEVFKDAIRRGIISPIKTDVREITLEQAKAIYLFDYWHKLRLNSVSDSMIAAEILDEDGIMGDKTLEALNRWSRKDKRALFICLNGFQFARYVAIVEGNGTQHRFVRGWTKRVQSYQA